MTMAKKTKVSMAKETKVAMAKVLVSMRKARARAIAATFAHIWYGVGAALRAILLLTIWPMEFFPDFERVVNKRTRRAAQKQK